MAKVLVVDDDAALRRMVVSALEQEGHRVRAVGSAEDGLAELRAALPDLLVLDVRLPGMSGFDLCRQLRAEPEHARLPVIFLTSKNDESHRIAGLELGGDDYIIKPFSVGELAARIKAVLRRVAGDGMPAEAVYAAGPLRVSSVEREAVVDGAPLRLTPKEFDILCLFLSKKKRVLTRPFLMERIWKQEYLPTSRTVDTHIKRLRRALGPLKDCIQTVESVGYRWVDPAGSD